MAILRLCLGDRNVQNLGLTNVTVVFDPPEHAKETYAKHGKLRIGEEYLFLGEVKNMPGHGIFIDSKTGQTLYGYHTENFYLVMEGIKIIQGKTEYDEEQYTVEEQDYPSVDDDDEDDDESDDYSRELAAHGKTVKEKNEAILAVEKELEKTKKELDHLKVRMRWDELDRPSDIVRFK